MKLVNKEVLMKWFGIRFMALYLTFNIFWKEN